MKKLQLVLLILIFSVSIISSKEQSDERQVFMFDSVMSLISDKSTPFIDRYYVTRDIGRLSREHQIRVMKELIPEAKDYADKAMITRIYSLISVYYGSMAQYSEAKTYLDSALIFVEKIDNEVVKGVTYYTAGDFYSNQNKISEAHENFYKAAECFSKKDPQLPILNSIYFNLAVIYSRRGDLESLHELIGWMKENSTTPERKILQYTIQADYFMTMYDRTGKRSDLDSVFDYNQKAFSLYDPEKQAYDVGYQIANNYFMQAKAFYLIYLNDSAKVYLDKTLEVINPNNIYGLLGIKSLYSQLLFNEERYDEAESGLYEGLHQLDSLENMHGIQYSGLFSEYYGLLSDVQEKQGKKHDALKSERESLKYALLHFDSENSEYIQDLRAKYDLDNKQRSIDQLTEINKMYERNRILYVGVGVLLFVIIVLIIFLSRRKQRIVQAELKEAKLISQLEQEKNETLTAKMNENEQQYKLLMSENKLKQVNSYLEGLESERLRLSKELHDNIANNILSVNLQLQNHADAGTSDALQQLKGIHEQVRNISHELIPPAFKYASFVEILRDYVNQQNSHDKINISLSIDSEKAMNEIPEKICLEFYRIIQECIGNALKHSDASHVEILLYKEDSQLNLTIIDNGKGFDMETKKNGIGLMIVKERVKSLNGVVNINSTIKKGTEFNITVPL
ncbi:MAG: sensor histidine kinase [Tannerella sp.]|jgi:signal transduction histidine kinase|nr:sensor histidine kinase [Tannerella sp.]